VVSYRFQDPNIKIVQVGDSIFQIENVNQ
jgi:hypothetical protein